MRFSFSFSFSFFLGLLMKRGGREGQQVSASVRRVHACRPTSHPTVPSPYITWRIPPVVLDIERTYPSYYYSTNHDTDNQAPKKNNLYLPQRTVHDQQNTSKKNHHDPRPRHNPSLPLPPAASLRRRAHNRPQNPAAPNLPLPLCSDPLHQTRTRVLTGPTNKKTNDGLAQTGRYHSLRHVVEDYKHWGDIREGGIVGGRLKWSGDEQG